MASLRLQFYPDLAYGAQGLQCFTYWNPVPGTWDFHDAPIDLDGNRTPVYDMVKEMNVELQARAGVFVGAKVLSVRHAGETVPPGVTPLGELPAPLTALDTHGNGAVVSMLENGPYRYLVIVNRSKRIKQVSEHTLTLYALLTGTVLFAALRLFQGGSFVEGIGNWQDWANLVGLAVVPTMISMLTLAVSSRYIGPTKTSILGVFEPLTAILIGTLLFGEPLTLKVAIGIAVCVGAVVFMILKPGKAS
jgi:hypothetical protein